MTFDRAVTLTSANPTGFVANGQNPSHAIQISANVLRFTGLSWTDGQTMNVTAPITGISIATPVATPQSISLTGA